MLAAVVDDHMFMEAARSLLRNSYVSEYLRRGTMECLLASLQIHQLLPVLHLQGFLRRLLTQTLQVLPLLHQPCLEYTIVRYVEIRHCLSKCLRATL
jgi:hypothetical protein